MTITLANLNTYKLSKRTIGTASWEARVTTIGEIAPDILTLQEVIVDETQPVGVWGADASAVIQQLAADTGLNATTVRTDGTPGPTAMANNHARGWYTAILWRPDTVTPVPGGFRPYGAPDFWHGLTTMQFDLGYGEPVTIASYHGDPFRPDFRANEALRLKSVFRQTGNPKPGLLLGDFNALSAATVDGQYYDAEPYLDQDHDDLEYQLVEGTIGKEQLADRRQTEALLRRGYMVDAAAHLGVPWQATAGHWADGQGDPDPWGARRIDLVYTTRPVVPALVGYRTHTSPAAKRAADHLPVICEIDPSRIIANVGPGGQG
ncbi:endonuclease/exonuclease/phosphatase family protein [Streptomyces acidiscabies]|uniref:Endonuclease/exonuclease/phosphatase family protein n=1 Tax=Streptomyces acidiscabies TaxID=42234 RepID=A0AAP6BGM2_9ACTN|nr:endonuclease/exonuclease/phosphatase family protein [Streptomyces acidiscabies]MBP5935366.1 endonuclease/exonuclease/phosphatase family protein [Streptomyces sp. LBUM 1476]MBZ3916792.1 endonuclease/exonuclease/phosphatase family protein [Streptomyces acidiscabies]MDX2964393.1 endonuclease/exonuclease/phosphatase family protein [Streptomyces acidiscabies]MDX3022942.1 endonuclease/exonuclease/phosphatase family protein [Streptomyces acidiscabies]MDX3794216.1 endonuclease/exonuclease/phosphata